ncbi:MAG: hypothetical protein EOO71_08935 [Myxococcaceae bacterium]|nr:MAG: hypothetical protein EOO71_08935 [Myxococcaceae bacterium]
MKTSSIRAFGVAAFAMAGLMVGCGGAPEDMDAPQGEDTQVQAPTKQEGEGEGREVRAMYYRWVCNADTVGLRYTPGGAVFAQIGRNEGVEVYSRDGNWMYVYRYATGQYGWTDATYYCV